MLLLTGMKLTTVELLKKTLTCNLQNVFQYVRCYFCYFLTTTYMYQVTSHLSQPTVDGAAPHRQWSKPKSTSQQHYPYMVLKSFFFPHAQVAQYRQVWFIIWTKIFPKQQANDSIMWEIHKSVLLKIFYYTLQFPSAPLSFQYDPFPIWGKKNNLHTQHQSASAFKRPQRGSVSQHFPILVHALRKINTNHRHNKYKDIRSICVNASFWFK